jgi:hypothetical protein
MTAILVGVLGSPARAEENQSTGLYAPFPSLSGSGRVERYVGEFGVRVTPAQIDRGTPLGASLSGAGGSSVSPAELVDAGDDAVLRLGLGAALALLAAGAIWLMPVRRAR